MTSKSTVNEDDERRMDQIQSEVERLLKLLKNREPGLMSWQMFFIQCLLNIQRIAPVHENGNDQSSSHAKVIEILIQRIATLEQSYQISPDEPDLDDDDPTHRTSAKGKLFAYRQCLRLLQEDDR